MRKHLVVGVVALLSVVAFLDAKTFAGKRCVPFKGRSAQQAVSAVPVDEGHVLVTTVGGGNATHLGRFEFVSPHLSGLFDFSIEGTQIFTAANGDVVEADIVGQLRPEVDEDGHVFLVGDVEGTITGGTGRFEGVSGEYTFSIVFDTETFASAGVIEGEICFPKK